MSREIIIDGCSIFIEDISQSKTGPYVNDSASINKVLKWTSEQLAEATKPVVTILKSLHDSAQEMAPDEMELSMQFGLGLNGEIPIFKIVSAEASAQIAVKCVWKKDRN